MPRVASRRIHSAAAVITRDRSYWGDTVAVLAPCLLRSAQSHMGSDVGICYTPRPCQSDASVSARRSIRIALTLAKHGREFDTMEPFT
ncbi:hypothetical protein BDW22DRAFT_438608 [Trametopsis cervina]|nr:hypothetical protein BDW22DRAFT_438608 [Trametopsis cervina]